MKGFKLDEKGDLLLANGDIVFLSEKELKQQTIQQVLGTKQGEWFLNREEGISFSNLLGKNVDEELVKETIEAGLLQVDETLEIQDFAIEKENRKRKLSFTAKNEIEEIEVVQDVNR